MAAISFAGGVSAANSTLVEFYIPDPVEVTTWSGIKARFR
jgi:hypothetical protein